MSCIDCKDSARQLFIVGLIQRNIFSLLAGALKSSPEEIIESMGIDKLLKEGK